MYRMEDPTVVAAMRAAPQNPVDREDFEIQVSPNYKAPCRIYYTTMQSDHVPPNPGSPPVKPVAPKPLPKVNPQDLSPEQTQARRTLEKQYKGNKAHYEKLLQKYKEERAAWERAYEAYHAATSHNDDSSADDSMPPDSQNSPRPDPLCIFTHGKSTTLDDPHVRSFCIGFARTAPIMLFQDNREEVLRVQTFRSLANSYPSAIAYSGRSLGARNAARATVYSTIKRAILITFPLVRGLDVRYTDLLALSSDTEVLFIIGDSDALCPETHLLEVRKKMRAKSWWIKLVGGDHKFLLWETKVIRDSILNIAGQMASKVRFRNSLNAPILLGSITDYAIISGQLRSITIRI